MIDRIFSAALTFCLLIGGTLAIGAAMFGLGHRSTAANAATAPTRVVQLERVVIVGKRRVPATEVARAEPREPVAAGLQ